MPPAARIRIPTESFYVANERIMAAVCGGQLTTDHVMGLSAFHAPAKDSATLIQSTRTAAGGGWRAGGGDG
jgi:hypothetical protein